MAVVTEKHRKIVDISKVVGGFAPVELKELHTDNTDAEDMNEENFYFVMQDKAGNKRVCVVNVDEFDDHLRNLGWSLERH